MRVLVGVPVFLPADVDEQLHRHTHWFCENNQASLLMLKRYSGDYADQAVDLSANIVPQ